MLDGSKAYQYSRDASGWRMWNLGWRLGAGGCRVSCSSHVETRQEQITRWKGR